ncbi:MAG: fatty acid desaturase [Myxococcota bacterium]
MSISSAVSVLPPLTDPLAPAAPQGLDAWVDRLALPWLVDSRDVVFTRLLARVATQIFPLALAMYLVPTWLVAVAAVPYLAFLFVRFGGRVMLALHAVSHRPLFSKRHRGFDRVFTHLLPMFWGLPPFAYRSHHVVMHHTENNGADDLSSTLSYQRDSPRAFFHYWLRFALFGYFHMGSWLARRGDPAAFVRLMAGDLVVYAAVGGLLWLNPAATTVVFLLPFALMRVFMMVGTWSEHAFVDVDAPTNSYRNSTCLLNTPYNHNAYNAGYHLIHHLRPGLHWAETVQYFEAHLPKLVAEDAIVFDGVQNNQQIWWKLMWQDYGYLADRLVDIGGRRPTREAKIAFLQERARRTRGPRKGLLERFEVAA